MSKQELLKISAYEFPKCMGRDKGLRAIKSKYYMLVGPGAVPEEPFLNGGVNQMVVEEELRSPD